MIFPLILACAITYQGSSGRFMDRFLGYIHAKWISHCTGVPLLYKPFFFSDQFAFHEFEKEDIPYEATKPFRMDEFLQDSTLYVIPFFSECGDDVSYTKIFSVDWNDKAFIEILREAFRPLYQYPKIPLSADFVNVAVHVRRGGGFDPGDSHYLWPLRFVPDSYYIDALRIVCNRFPNQPIYAHIFTDDSDPASIIRRYADALHGLPITFGGRIEGNRHDLHIVEDFLAMMDFDCIVRSQSNFSLLPAKIGKCKLAISPKHNCWIRKEDFTIEQYIDDIEIEVRY